MSGARAPVLDPDVRIASTAQLRTVLARALRRRHSRAHIVEIERAPGAYGSSWWLEDVTVHLDDGSRISLVFKDLDREADGSDARRIKPAFVTDPAREAWVYRTLLARARAGSPELWGAVTDSAVGRHWLLLERVNGVPLSEIGDRTTWRHVARWLGSFHTTAPVPRGLGTPLLRHGREYHREWMRRGLAQAESQAAHRTSEGARARGKLARLRALAPFHERALDVALVTDEALIHGEFYPSNVIVESRGNTCAIHPVDWEMAALGPPLLDLGALLSGGWGAQDQLAMVTAYREGAEAAGRVCPPLYHFLRELAACRLLLAIQWQGWASGWNPPPDHRNDWLEEAERCAQELSG